MSSTGKTTLASASQDKQAAGVGLVLWGDLKVLIDSPEVNDGSEVWKNQNTWNIQSQLTGQETTLPHAFTTGTLQDPAPGNWNMDTGASSHLNDSVNNLSDVFNSCIYPSVVVGDGHSIPVTNSGNNEFDPFGFSVKDFQTRRILLRCNNTEPLYLVTNPSSIPQVNLTSRYMWHQRLGHPGSEVLHSVSFNNSISCNKEKSPVLCHACQLGKHVRLPFVSSSTFIRSSFEIIHSDL
ncbi:ribonuclease H-like domain-containing protein [Tanacetum coccineum]